ncbi:polysaccharide deacetylase family protein [Streptomyces sp. NPDC048577]|uniref:polysaccharide deacetylase family protein n=1 Tax=Streptomyces sp. NPDC048577 TaxID=3157209 RepID=UPI00341291C7
MTLGKHTAHIAVVASAIALTGAVWGASVLTGPEPGDAGRVPAATDRPSARPAPVRPAPKIPESIAHASEAGGRAVNITIDDGPDPRWTPDVLRVLRKNDVKAVFCMIGPQARRHPDLVKRIVADGHRLCDHTTDHDTAMDGKSVEYQRRQIMAAKKMIEDAAGGAKVEYYRAPGGAFTPDSRRIAAAAGMRPLGWNVDTKDFHRPGVAAIVATVREELPNGPTILFHDGGGDRGQTVSALEELLPWLAAQGHPTGFPVRTRP